MHRVNTTTAHALHNAQSTRHIEQLLQSQLPAHTLMQRASLAVARLALAISPHSQRIWIACGPGNNGGDGLEAAMHLQQWGKKPVVTWLGHTSTAPTDAAASQLRAQGAGVEFSENPPARFDLCIDALTGLGGGPRPLKGRMSEWAAAINHRHAPVLAIDLPTGLCADTGVVAENHVKATHTLSLLTLKPGLFTASGRDAAGEVWQDALTGGAQDTAHTLQIPPTAWLGGASNLPPRAHASHKGSYGDVAVIGGASGMTGAALLAASAALNAGAGRVFVGLLDASLTVNTMQPELMFRAVHDLDLSAMTVVCGCGGGEAIQAHMETVLMTSAHAVIDADAINSIASSNQLRALLQSRVQRGKSTILTPHPLEAARLLGVTTAEIQNNRIHAAQTLAQELGCTLVLKGSGTIVAAQGRVPVINPTGNAKLATAGTGDVLAGLIGASLAAGLSAFEAATHSVYLHGMLADGWPDHETLTAHRLALAVGRGTISRAHPATSPTP